tara:strand:+ start:8176 stop:10257 length:2082 start_codon:yes stop_codon:yes gene_type:complete
MPFSNPVGQVLSLVQRGYNKPPHVIGRWIWRKLKARRTAKVLPGWERWLGPSSMTAALNAESFDTLNRTIERANPFPGLKNTAIYAAALTDTQKTTIIDRARRAMAHEVDFLGSGPVSLGPSIDWTCDFKSNMSWPMKPSRRLPVNDPKSASDIKVPWELSRLQWVLPVGQAYVLDGDEAYAGFTRAIVDDWINKNPVCHGPNWMCAMDVALRAISMVWLFQACKASPAWRDEDFRARLIKSLILHAKFIDGNLEYADVNGNHLVADLAGLTLIGLALGGEGIAKKWVNASWSLLVKEFPIQVPDDGVCREASVPYHRFVAELYLLPALARRARGLEVEDAYWARLANMAPFVTAYTRPDGEVPIWGDADDGRALPLGTQALNDHGYLAETLISLDGAPARPAYDETLWWLGAGDSPAPKRSAPQSAAFKDAGVYVLRDDKNYVFVDAGPVGMAGRGGHGHNDCLAFEAALQGTRLIVDPGAYVYTADAEARNRFRGTAMHNTPQINDQEINRMPRADWLWYLSDDAVPEVRHWNTSDDVDLLVAAHSGYQRLTTPVTPVRAVMLEKSTGRLFIADGFDCPNDPGTLSVRTPFTFAPGVGVENIRAGVWRLQSSDSRFLMINAYADSWQAKLENGEVSPAYGIEVETQMLAFRRNGPLQPLVLAIIPEHGAPPDPVRWLEGVVKGCFPIPGLN